MSASVRREFIVCSTMRNANEVYAVKRVTLESIDAETLKIALLWAAGRE